MGQHYIARGWGGDNANFTATYTDNKRNGLTYGPAGHLVFDGGQTFTYDATGQQATASFPSYLLEQFYDGDGLRVKKSDAGTVTLYLRSSVLGGQVVAEMSSTGAWQRGYVYLGSQLLAIQQSGVYWVHQDPLVKSKRVTNSSGNVVSTLELDPWGGNTNRNNNDVFQTHRFTNYDRDLNAADEAMFRRYHRWWSRFDQPDPYDGSYNLINPQPFNRYAYVNNDPMNLVDQTGLHAMPAGPCPRENPCEITVGGGSDPFDASFGGPPEVYPILIPREPLPIGGGGPQNPTQTPTPPNPKCITNAVSGATLARPFGNVGPTGIIGHNGVHVVASPGSQVTTLPALTGTVLGRPRIQWDGLFAQDVLINGGNVAIYKDLATVTVRPGQRLRAGSVIGTVGDGSDYVGLHFTLLRGGRNERNYYRSLTSTGQSNKIKVGMFINPLGPNSPVNCPGVPVNNAGVNPHP